MWNPLTEVKVAKRNELHIFAVIPKLRVVERSFGWLDKCYRLWKNCERDMQNSFQMVVIAFILYTLKKMLNRLLCGIRKADKENSILIRNKEEIYV